MKLSYCPQVKIVHTSRTFHGQLYVPFVNWILMIGAVLVTAIYNNTTRLGAAYGVCVMFVTFFDTSMVTLVSLIVWRLPVWLVFLPWLVFASIDGLYLSSALNKVPEGAWFTLTVSSILALIFLLWRFGKESQWKAEAEDRFQPSHLVAKDDTGKLQLTRRWGGDYLSPVRGLGIFFDKTGVLTPSVFTHFASKLGALPDVSVFFHLHPVEVPSVPDHERYSISRLPAIPGCYRLVVRHGFMDEVVSPDLGALIYEQVRRFLMRQAAEKSVSTQNATSGGGNSETNPPDSLGEVQTSEAIAEAENSSPDTTTKLDKATRLHDERIAAELARLDQAYSRKILYVVGKGQMKIRGSTAIWRRISLGIFLWIRDNTRAKIANLRLAMDRVVEVGFVKDI
jgi:KUP system potassium uptake protein